MKNNKGYKQKHKATETNIRIKELNSIKQLMAKNSFSKAHAELIRYMSNYPTDMFGVFLYGRLQLKLEDYEAAKETFKKVASHNGNNRFSALSELGNIAVEENDFETARKYYKQVINESPNPEEFTVLAWARLERRTRNLEEALRILNMSSFTTNRITLEKVKCLYLMDKIPEARALIDKLSTHTTDDMFNRSVYLEKARLEKIDGTYEQANKYLDQAKTGAKDFIYVQSVYEEAKVNLKYEQYAKALDACQELMTLHHPYEDGVFLMRGMSYHGKKEIPKAIKDYQIAVASTDEDTKGTASFHLGNILFAKGDFEQAEKLYLDSLTTYGEIHEAGYFKLIALYIKQNRLDEAEMLLNNLLEKFPEKKHDLSFIIAIRAIQSKRGIKLPTDSMVYVEKQIIDYNKSAALAHIRARHIDDCDNKTKFRSDIDLNELYSYVQQQMTEDSKINEDIMDVYSIDYQNIGEDNGQPIHHIRVVTIPNTKNILTMYPSEEYFLPRKCDYKQQDETPKQMSRVDKFNARFAQSQKKKISQQF